MENELQDRKVNEILKSRREQKRLSIHMIHQETKISIVYLEALESGQWNIFPAEVYLLGFLRKYSNYLGLDPEEMVQCYKKEIDVIRIQEQEKEKKETEVKKQLETKSLIKGFVLLCVIIFFGIWWSYTALKSFREGSEKKIEPVQIGKKFAKSIFTQGEQLILNIQPSANVWVRVMSDKTLSFEGFLSSATSRSWEAKNEFVVRLGNANLVKITLNGIPIDAIHGAQKSVNEIQLTHQTILGESMSSPIQSQEDSLHQGTTEMNPSTDKNEE